MVCVSSKHQLMAFHFFFAITLLTFGIVLLVILSIQSRGGCSIRNGVPVTKLHPQVCPYQAFEKGRVYNLTWSSSPLPFHTQMNLFIYLDASLQFCTYKQDLILNSNESDYQKQHQDDYVLDSPRYWFDVSTGGHVCNPNSFSDFDSGNQEGEEGSDVSEDSFFFYGFFSSFFSSRF